MAMNTDIISKGRIAKVTDEQLDELRALKVSWLAYCQARLTRSHESSVEHLTRFRRVA